MFVSTVTGRIAPEALGVTLPHEHLLASFATPEESDDGWRRVGRVRPVAAADAHLYDSPVTIERLGALNLAAPNRDNWTLDDEALAIAEAGEFAALGGRTIVDQTSIGLGRNPSALRRVAEETGLAVVMGAGWHSPAWTPEIAERSAESLADEIVRDLTEGVDGIRAGIIGRIAALDPAVAAERTLLLAVASAARRTGAPVSIDAAAEHTDTLALLDLLAGEGVDLSRVALGGCGRFARTPEALDALAARGVFLQFDRLGDIPTILTEVSDHDIAMAIIRLAAEGFDGSLLVSNGVHRKIDLSAFGGNGYGFIARQYAPYLTMFGGDDALIQALTVDNPRRLLTITQEAAA